MNILRAGTMAPAELERANTWLLDIVDTLSEGVKWRQEGHQNHAVDQGGLSINLRKGCWQQHSTHKGGWNTLLLVAHLEVVFEDSRTVRGREVFEPQAAKNAYRNALIQRLKFGRQVRCLGIIHYLGVFRQGDKFLAVPRDEIEAIRLPISLCLFDALA